MKMNYNILLGIKNHFYIKTMRKIHENRFRPCSQIFDYGDSVMQCEYK